VQADHAAVRHIILSGQWVHHTYSRERDARLAGQPVQLVDRAKPRRMLGTVEKTRLEQAVDIFRRLRA